MFSYRSLTKALMSAILKEHVFAGKQIGGRAVQLTFG